MGLKDIITYVITLAGWVAVLATKFNDLKHLKKDLETMQAKYEDDKKTFWKRFDKLNDDIEDVKNEVIEIKTRCNERHRK